MKILFADAISEKHVDRLQRRDQDVILKPTLQANELPEHVAGVDILVVRSTVVDQATIDASDHLGMIVRAGAGTDNIDTAAASAMGIYVCNVPGRNAVAVAELTMGLLLAIDRRIADNVVDLRAGRWNKGLYSKADGILDKKLAVIGVGEIGLALAERAKAFGMTVMAERRDARPERVQQRIRSIGIRLAETRKALLGDADVVSLHVPGAEETRHLVDDEFLDQMNDGAILLNTSRGDVIDEEALLRAMDEKGLRAGLDVWPSEPGGKDGPFRSQLAAHPNVVGTHHIGASTLQAQRSIAEGTVAVIDAYLDGRIINCVNLNERAVGQSCLRIRHLDEVGVLAQVFEALRANGLNVQHMENQIFSGAGAAVATVYLGGDPSTDLLDRLEAIPEVLAVTSVPIDGAER